jgi:hypothetical protein
MEKLLIKELVPLPLPLQLLLIGVLQVNYKYMDAYVMILSHPILEGKPNANHVCARTIIHVHINYIIGHHHTVLK